MTPRWLRSIWRMGDIQLPVGTPWFRVRRFWFLPIFPVGYPICWQGWAAATGLVGWMAASAAFFVHMNWEPSNAFLYGWLFPTLVVWLVVVGIKTEVLPLQP